MNGENGVMEKLSLKFLLNCNSCYKSKFNKIQQNSVSQGIFFFKKFINNDKFSVKG